MPLPLALLGIANEVATIQFVRAAIFHRATEGAASVGTSAPFAAMTDYRPILVLIAPPWRPVANW